MSLSPAKFLILLPALAVLLVACGGTSPADWSATAAVDAIAPSRPTGVTAAAAGSSVINLSWNASTDNVAVAGYVVSRNGTPVATPATTSYIDTGLSPATPYTYNVAAVDAAGNVSPNSTNANATTAAGTGGDTIPPSTPTGLTATATGSSSIDLSWIASTDNVAVAKYVVRRNGTQVATPAATSYSDTGLSAATTYSYTVAAVDAAGNSSPPASASATTAGAPPPPPGAQDFPTRCAQTGVIRCVAFDSASEISGVFGDNFGINDSGATTPVLDTSVKASGASSLKFTIPSNSGADTSGSFFTNFSPDLSVQFGANAEFYVQWRQRFSAEFVNTQYTNANGWKQIIIGTGDKPGTVYSSCTALETVVQNSNQRKFPQMYNSCTGSSTRSAFMDLQEGFGSDVKLQNARLAPYCLASQSGANRFPPNGNCFAYFPDEWMTFQVRIKTGPRVNDNWTGSRVTLWVARQGQASQLVIDMPWTLVAGDPAEDQTFGKVWLLPYDTNKSAAQVHPTAFTWYDELIISRTQIADPQ